eukprot:COSAG03_NODE_307_length_9149_cov_3.027293_4_plen_181_part_00
MMVMFGCSRFMTTQRLCWQRRSVQNVPQSVKCASQCVPCMSSTSVLWCLSAARFMWNNSAESVVDSRSTSKSSALRDSVPLQSVYCTASGSGAAVRLALEPTRPALVRLLIRSTLMPSFAKRRAAAATSCSTGGAPLCRRAAAAFACAQASSCSSSCSCSSASSLASRRAFARLRAAVAT